jgi:hypothetical protein
MNPEKEIVTWWLNRKGYFTLSSINAGMNKEIDIIAIKLDDGLKELIHYEIMVSISHSISDESQKSVTKIIDKKFNDNMVQKKLQSIIKEHIGHFPDYKKCLVLGTLSKKKEIKDKFKNQGIDVIMFDDIMHEVTDF